jgi:uncharacterized 2Fe-2S/4Fe-4S cluster protein (DUF4445 family)
MKVQAEPGTTLLAVLQRTGWHISAPCGGAGSCGKCIVQVDPPAAGGPPSPAESRLIAENPSARLACRCRPEADLRVILPQSAVAPARGTDAKGGDVRTVHRGRPAIVRLPVQLASPSLEDQRSVCERIREAAGTGSVKLDPRVAAEATDLLQAQSVELIVDESGTQERPILQTRTRAGLPVAGLAFDIGTTTVAGYLVDLESGLVLASSSQANAQGTYGADVISRITAAGSGEPLGAVIRDQLNRMTELLLKEAGITAHELCAVTIVGNTTMTHLLLDLDPGPISRAPFIPAEIEAISVPAADLIAECPRGATAYIAPCVSSYVGADIVSDLIATGVHEKEKLSVLIDVGTNGEIVAGTRDRLVACSTAAGPAFEGATITFGSAGVAGAISHVERKGGFIKIETIEGEPARTICGTGLIDAVAMLLTDGVVDETGRLQSTVPEAAAAAYSDRLIAYHDEPAVLLTDPSDPSAVCVTQSDIRQVQLAKGAIAAGVRVLLDSLDADAGQIERVYLAGGFGTFVRPESALRVGLLPPIESHRVEPVGNAAGAGAVALLLSADARHQAQNLRNRVRYLELSGLPSFQELYMEEMFFPTATS